MDWTTNNDRLNERLVDYREGLNQAARTRMVQYQTIGGGKLSLDQPEANHVCFDPCLKYVHILFFVRRCDENNRVIPGAFALSGLALAWKE